MEDTLKQRRVGNSTSTFLTRILVDGTDKSAEKDFKRHAIRIVSKIDLPALLLATPVRALRYLFEV